MCGIFALLNIYPCNTNNMNYFEKCFNKGKNRGPEYSSFNIYNNYILGFHRLAINGYNDEGSNQPLIFNNINLVCNGEIYNYKKLYAMLDIQPNTLSDCEIIIHLYIRYGIKQTLQLLDGVFAFILIDNTNKCMYVARDTYGIRPLFSMTYNKKFANTQHAFASELKQLPYIEHSNMSEKNIPEFDINQFTPGCYQEYRYSIGDKGVKLFYKHGNYVSFSSPNSFINSNIRCEEDAYPIIFDALEHAVIKRVNNTDREVACLLSGGLDSSIIAALVKKHYNKPLHTWSIGFKGSDDLKFAKIVATHIGSIHHCIEVDESEFLKNIENVIYAIESYDTTTVRASVGNWLISKYIKNKSDAKVVFNGDGSDELTGGYMYFHLTKDPCEFDKECRRLLSDIHYYDVLRSDRSISFHGLEARTPFLDRNFVQQYLSIPHEIRCHGINNKCEKYLLRKAVEVCNPGLLPDNILWRTKEAFSDGVSDQTRSWFTVVDEYMKDVIFQNKTIADFNVNNISHNTPKTLEQLYYRKTFNKYFNRLNEKLIPYFWMPKYVEATDSSARTLNIYKHKLKQKTE